VQIVKTLTEHVSKYAQIVLDSCAYAGTGNVLKVQELLGLCGEHIETEEATAWKVRQQRASRGHQHLGLTSRSSYGSMITIIQV
jgi:26S proteasome regulatory subunit N1